MITCGQPGKAVAEDRNQLSKPQSPAAELRREKRAMSRAYGINHLLWNNSRRHFPSLLSSQRLTPRKDCKSST